MNRFNVVVVVVGYFLCCWLALNVMHFLKNDGFCGEDPNLLKITLIIVIIATTIRFQTMMPYPIPVRIMILDINIIQYLLVR